MVRTCKGSVVVFVLRNSRVRFRSREKRDLVPMLYFLRRVLVRTPNSVDLGKRILSGLRG